MADPNTPTLSTEQPAPIAAGAEPGSQARRLPPRRRAGGGWLRYGFVAPALLLLIAMNIFPLLYDVRLSFTDAQLTRPQFEYVGGQNYARVFGEPAFARAIRTTALFVVCAVSIELVLGFGMALALRERFRGKTVVLTLLLIPMMLSPAVMGMFWRLILDPQYGILNQGLAGLAGALPGGFGDGVRLPDWLNDPQLKFLSILIIDVWMWTPFMMLIALAGLNAIPQYIYEAAEIDRAGWWTVFRRITLPMAAPLLVLAVLFRATDALKQFDLVMAVTGPDEVSTQTLSVLLYQTMFGGFRTGLASAYAVVVLVIVIALATVFTRYINRMQARQGRVEA